MLNLTGVSSVYELPKKESLPETGFPSDDYPSDHLALGYEFVMTRQE